tara:strand:- start:1465 stop:2511 length:1047 start_codon:yes stop_codon:yes gene_type:complete
MISSRADIGGGPKHLIDLISEKPNNFIVYAALPFGQDYSLAIQTQSRESIEIPFRKFSLAAFFRILAFIKRRNIKTVHSHGRGAGLYSRALKLFGVRVIHTFHGVHDEKGFKGLIKLKLDQILRGLTDQFISVSPSEYQKALSYKVCSLENTSVIVNGVKLQKQLQVSFSNAPTVALLGRLSFPKGYDILISYIDKFIEENQDLPFKINIAGEGESLQELMEQLDKTQYAKNKIKFIGKTLEPLIFLSKHEAFMSFSRFEGLPLSVLEAMSLGRACLLSNVVGNRDVCPPNSRSAILFQLDSYDDFQHKFKELLTNPALRKELSSNAFKTVDKFFSVSTMAKKTFNLY